MPTPIPLAQPLANLISEMNPSCQQTNPLERLLAYRSSPTMVEVDSSNLVRSAYAHFYGEHEVSIASRADTILNPLPPLKMFAIFRLTALSLPMPGLSPFVKSTQGAWCLHPQLLTLVRQNLPLIFAGYPVLYQQFQDFAQVSHAFANFMPVPQGYNGTPTSFGKGSYTHNNDYPLFYYQNLQAGQSPRCKQWLDPRMEPYYLGRMFAIVPPFPHPTSYCKTQQDISALARYVAEATLAIQERGHWIATQPITTGGAITWPRPATA